MGLALMMDNLSPQTKAAFQNAAAIARRLVHAEVRSEHLILGAMTVVESDTAKVLAGYGLAAFAAETRLRTLLPPGSVPAGSALFAEPVRSALATVSRSAAVRGGTVGLTAFVRELLATDNAVVTDLFASVHLSTATVRAALDALTAPSSTPTDGVPGPESGSVPADPASAPSEAAGGTAVLDAPGPAAPGTPPAAEAVKPGSALAAFGRDLVGEARAGHLAPVSGRESELDRVLVILGRRTKNNPVLIGEPGVGKTAVVEGLAQLLASGTAPAHLADRPLIGLDLASMVAGARYRGDFEARLKRLLAEATACNAILFVDEVHTLVHAGAGGGALDAGNMLKEGLSRGQLTLIGATTLTEYRKHIEPDAALERRLQTVLVAEPTVAGTVDILRTLRPGYEAHHGVRYSDEALSAAATLAARYIPDRFLPDKAIDVLDEAGAAAGMKVMQAPAQLRSLYATRNRLRSVTAPAAAGTAAGSGAAPVDVLLSGEGLTEDGLTSAIVAAGGVDLQAVGTEQMAQVVATATGIPVTAITEGEADSLRTLADRLSARVIGQTTAVAALARAVRRRRALPTPRPASFIFAGPTGVGKSELAKALADALFGDGAVGRGQLITVDMSEFAEKHTVSRLIGAPPGYAGSDQPGQLTEQVRRHPYAVLLLDEVEKAHTDIFDLLLQILEDGHLSDAAGRRVDFSHTIIILTSNLGGTSKKKAGFSAGELAAAEGAEADVQTALKAHFRPEFLNRIDEVVVFNRLSRVELGIIVDTMLTRLNGQLADRGLTLQLTSAATEVLLIAGFDPVYGARPLRRAITELLENPLSERLLAGTLPAGSHVIADHVAGQKGLTLSTLEDLVELDPEAELAVELEATTPALEECG
jgi:ATP-dependent Clp protease ATP-binding subunit ClpC